MAREKGSKNRTTLVKELHGLGRTESFDGWDYASLRNELERAHKVVVPVPAPVVVEPADLTIIDVERATAILQETRARCVQMAVYYAPDAENPQELVPERVQEFLRHRIYTARDESDARQVQRQALEKMHIHLLALWGRKAIAGPNTAQNLAKRAKKTMDYADKMAKDYQKGDRKVTPERIEAQRAKARAIALTPVVARPPAFF